MVCDADAYLPGVEAVPLDDNHISVTKPKSNKSQLYIGVREFIRECVASPDGRTHGDGADPFGERSRRIETFRDRVASVAKHREGEKAVIRPLSAGDPPVDYLVVTEDDPICPREKLIGLCESGVDEPALSRFVTVVVSEYRKSNPKVPATIVHGGEPARRELVEAAKEEGVRLISFPEFQGLIDFSNYLQFRRVKLKDDEAHYPSDFTSPSEWFMASGAASARSPASRRRTC